MLLILVIHQLCPVATTGLHIPPTLGVNVHCLSGCASDHEVPGASAYLSRAFSLIRNDVKWGACEKEPGVYDFTALEAQLATVKARGLRFHGIFDYTSPLYDAGLSPHSPAGREAFAAWATATVRHARGFMGGQGGTGFLWEMYNEPNLNVTSNRTACQHPGGGAAESELEGWTHCKNTTSYSLLALAVGRELKAAFPDEIYVGPAVGQVWGCEGCSDWTGLDTPFLTKCFEMGVLEYWDAITIHPYIPFKPEQARDEFDHLKALVAKYAPPGKDIPLLSGEWGYSTSDQPRPGGPYANESTQGKYLPRMFLHNVMMGVNLSVWYDWHDDGPNASYVENNFGTVRNAASGNSSRPFEPKPAYLAALALTEHTARRCPDYRATETFVVPSGSSCYANHTCFNHTLCYASYWGGCDGGGDGGGGGAGGGDMIAVWCGANDGWSTKLVVPVGPGRGGTPATMAKAVAAGTRCFARVDWLGRELQSTAVPLLCATSGAGGTGGVADPSVEVQASNGVMYLLPTSTSR